MKCSACFRGRVAERRLRLFSAFRGRRDLDGCGAGLRGLVSPDAPSGVRCGLRGLWPGGHGG